MFLLERKGKVIACTGLKIERVWEPTGENRVQGIWRLIASDRGKSGTRDLEADSIRQGKIGYKGFGG